MHADISLEVTLDPMVLSNRNITHIMPSLDELFGKRRKSAVKPICVMVEHHYMTPFCFTSLSHCPSEKALKHLEIKLPSPGMENVLMLVFHIS